MRTCASEKPLFLPVSAHCVVPYDYKVHLSMLSSGHKYVGNHACRFNVVLCASLL